MLIAVLILTAPLGKETTFKCPFYSTMHSALLKKKSLIVLALETKYEYMGVARTQSRCSELKKVQLFLFLCSYVI